MSQMAESEEGKEFAEGLFKAARKSLGLPEPTSAADTPPTFTPAFDANGYGRTDNSVVSIGARRALSAPSTRWHFDVEGFPVFTHENAMRTASTKPAARMGAFT